MFCCRDSAHSTSSELLADDSTRQSEAIDDVWSKISRDFKTKWVDTGIMPQTTIAVCRKDGEVFRHSFGVPEDAIFQLMSMTKLVTTIAVLQLQDAGKLSIEDSVSKYLKSFGSRPNITIKMLLNHTWGQSYLLGFVDGSKHWSLEERAAADKYLPAKQLEYDMSSWAEVQSTLPQLFEPGERFCYSAGPNVAGAIVEAVSGQSYAQYLSWNHIYFFAIFSGLILGRYPPNLSFPTSFWAISLMSRQAWSPARQLLCIFRFNCTVHLSLLQLSCTCIISCFCYIFTYYYAKSFSHEHVYVVPLGAFYLSRSTRPTFAGRIILLGDDHDPARGSWCWQRMMILADDHDPGRQACSCWNSMIFVENKEAPSRDHLGTTLGPP